MKDKQRLFDCKYIGTRFVLKRTEVDIDSSDEEIEKYIEEKRAEFYDEWFEYIDDRRGDPV